MRKILIIGSGDSIFVKDFIKQMASQNVIVDLLSVSSVEKLTDVRSQINMYSNEKKENFLYRQLRVFFDIKHALRVFDDNYDSVVIHFIYFFLAPHIYALKKKSDNIVSVIWGSDFYRSGVLQKVLQRIIYKSSKSIVFTNPDTKQAFINSEKKINADALKVARFGLPALDEINELRLRNVSREVFCEKFQLPSDKVLISVGYNASLAHMHLLVIDKFSSLPGAVKDNAFLIFPLGYGDFVIKNTIVKKLQDSGLENYIVLEKFYAFADIAMLRCATDVLVNIQPSDQFSGSMQEVLYAGGRVIAGGWLPYRKIIDSGGAIKNISKESDVGEALEDEILLGVKKSLYPKKSIIDFIEDSSSWKKNIKLWNSIIFN